MRKRLAIALALAFASLALATAFGLLMWQCGRLRVEATEPGEPAGEAQCVSVLYPLVPVWAGFALVGAVGLWFGHAWPAITLGAIGFLLGILAGLSAGFYGIGCGALLLAAGLVGAGPRAQARAL